MRTTRSVAPTEAGDRLIETLRPAFHAIDAKLAALGELREKPAGTIRITTREHAAETILWPALAELLPDHRHASVELSMDPTLTDIVSERFDAGVRPGKLVAENMIAVRIGPDVRTAVVGAPFSFAARSKPKTPHDRTLAPVSDSGVYAGAVGSGRASRFPRAITATMTPKANTPREQ